MSRNRTGTRECCRTRQSFTGGVPEGWGGSKFLAFFHAPATIFILSSLFWWSSRGISVVFEVLGPSKMRVWSSLGHRVRRLVIDFFGGQKGLTILQTFLTFSKVESGKVWSFNGRRPTTSSKSSSSSSSKNNTNSSKSSSKETRRREAQTQKK